MRRFAPIFLFGPVIVLGFLAGRALADTPAPAFDLSILELAFRGIAEGNWFLVAGPILAVVVRFGRPALGHFWPTLATSDRWGVAITAAFAGAGAIAHAWIADEPVADSMTLLGAVKVFVMAVATYVTTRKLLAPTSRPQAGFARLEAMLVVTLLGALLLPLASGCAASTREKTIRATYIGLSSAQEAFVAWDKAQRDQLAASATSELDGVAKLTAYQKKRQPAIDAFEAAWRALYGAKIVDDDPSVATAVAAATQVYEALTLLTGRKWP